MYKRNAFGALESFSLRERVMNQKQIQVKFWDQVQVLEVKKRQLVSNLLRCDKQDIPLYEGESEYTKKKTKRKKKHAKETSKGRCSNGT